MTFLENLNCTKYFLRSYCKIYLVQFLLVSYFSISRLVNTLGIALYYRAEQSRKKNHIEQYVDECCHRECKFQLFHTHFLLLDCCFDIGIIPVSRPLWHRLKSSSLLSQCIDQTVRPQLLFSFGTFDSFLVVRGRNKCTVHIILSKRPIKEFLKVS